MSRYWQNVTSYVTGTSLHCKKCNALQVTSTQNCNFVTATH